jgi:hypothetical protein
MDGGWWILDGGTLQGQHGAGRMIRNTHKDG